jgi:hypothetical protein
MCALVRSVLAENPFDIQRHRTLDAGATTGSECDPEELDRFVW